MRDIICAASDAFVRQVHGLCARAWLVYSAGCPGHALFQPCAPGASRRVRHVLRCRAIHPHTQGYGERGGGDGRVRCDLGELLGSSINTALGAATPQAHVGGGGGHAAGRLHRPVLPSPRPRVHTHVSPMASTPTSMHAAVTSIASAPSHTIAPLAWSVHMQCHKLAECKILALHHLNLSDPHTT